ncbi:HPP family protein [Acetobacter tropicalis]|nr:HPP family protein [Acetobacter tropicalis]
MKKHVSFLPSGMTLIRPKPSPVLIGLGGVCGILTSMLVTGCVTPASLPALVAPIGASSVLVFALPASPLASPRAVIGGNMISAMVGVLVSLVVSNPMPAAGLAVGLAILVMSLTRTLHPPGGAAALTSVLMHPSSAGLGAAFLFPIVPVGLNSVLLVGVGVAFHHLTGHTYPHQALPAPPQKTGVQREDILAALSKTDEAFDIEVDDLERLLVLAESHAHQRQTQPPRPAAAAQ